MKHRRVSFSRIGFLLLMLWLTLVSSGCTLNAFERAEEQAEALPTPTPELAPDQVVRIQLEALQHNDRTNQGIAAAFNFASPDNKKVTGPLPRFIKMLKSPPYQSMLNHKSVEYGDIKITGDTATQRVVLTGSNGQVTIYIFILSRQTEEPCKECWMTDSVIVEPTKELPQGQA